VEEKELFATHTRGDCMKKRRIFDAKFRAKVTIEAIKGQKTIAELSSEFSVHANQITTWKREALNNFYLLFQKENTNHKLLESEEKMKELYKIIGEMKVENDFLKKKLTI
jgi:transposase